MQIAIAIKDLNNTSMFSFSNVFVADVKNKIRKLDTRKATENTKIPARILSKQNSDIFGSYICDFLNEFCDKGVFPSILIYSINYRPVSILKIISKICDKLLSKQIIIYMDQFFPKYQCRFRK